MKRVYTEANLDDEHVLKEIEECVGLLCGEAKENSQDEPCSGNIDLVLELDSDAAASSSLYQCRYYFADNKKRTLFWKEAHVPDESKEPEDLQGANSKSHKGMKFFSKYLLALILKPLELKLESLYWYISCR